MDKLVRPELERRILQQQIIKYWEKIFHLSIRTNVGIIYHSLLEVFVNFDDLKMQGKPNEFTAPPVLDARSLTLLTKIGECSLRNKINVPQNQGFNPQKYIPINRKI